VVSDNAVSGLGVRRCKIGSNKEKEEEEEEKKKKKNQGAVQHTVALSTFCNPY
jgi:hypothetical protein